jgi:hypothetical protein
MKTTYLNFIPTEGFQLYANALLDKLTNLAPSDASSSSFFEKRGRLYACKIEIISAAQRFEAVIESLHPKSSLEQARRRVLRQIARWRRLRFA